MASLILASTVLLKRIKSRRVSQGKLAGGGEQFLGMGAGAGAGGVPASHAYRPEDQ